ncbi:DUF1360 domain-containing protein [Bacillus sp. FJAT-47783]|uniref:DUF1360 domain-containing protein n=1 Tax=Bacillus sp. FJAT-47783 TaxID=2922712 RepID=UPI001FAD5277|nr:DUF1360 domain-containing protein [Bacillus sp. FJAT-47783]
MLEDIKCKECRQEEGVRLSVFEFLLLAFASFRLTRLLVFDKITEFLRRPFHRTLEETLPDGTVEEYIEIKGTGLRKWIGELLSCHWCTGVWSAIFLYVIYRYQYDLAEPLIIILAIAGLAAIVETIVERVMEH